VFFVSSSAIGTGSSSAFDLGSCASPSALPHTCAGFRAEYKARKYTDYFSNGQLIALFSKRFVGRFRKRSMSAYPFVANMFPYGSRFQPVRSVTKEPHRPFRPCFSLSFRTLGCARIP